MQMFGVDSLSFYHRVDMGFMPYNALQLYVDILSKCFLYFPKRVSRGGAVG
jgi:hypothetical protein